MTPLPHSLHKGSAQWVAGIALIIIGDLAGMVATFLPMKAVLILASNEVPTFFPAALVQEGATFSSLALLTISLLLGGVSTVGSKLLMALDNTHANHSTRDARVPGLPTSGIKDAREQRLFVATAVLLIPVVGTLLAVSITYVALTVVWILGSAAVLSWSSKQSLEGLQGEHDEALRSEKLSKWLQVSALWSVVGIAIITLLVNPPTLGSTAILLAAVFGRRLILAAAKLGAEVLSFAARGRVQSGARSNQLTQANANRSKPRRNPLHHLSHDANTKALSNYLVSIGIAPRDFLVIGNPGSSVVTVLAAPDHDHQVLLRVFAPEKTDLYQSELGRRIQHGGAIYPDIEATTTEIAGLPTIRLNLVDETQRINPYADITRQEVAQLQVGIEVSASNLFESEALTECPVISGEEMAMKLHGISPFLGADSALCDSVASSLPGVTRLLSDVPISLVPTSALGARDCYKTTTGSVTYLGGHCWHVGRIGDHWGPTVTYEKALRASVSSGVSASPIRVDLVALNAILRNLDRAVERSQLGALSKLLKIVDKRSRRVI